MEKPIINMNFCWNLSIHARSYEKIIVISQCTQEDILSFGNENIPILGIK